jgi:hypothetical protein
MQDSGNQNASSDLPVKYNVPATLHTPEAGTDIIASAA